MKKLIRPHKSERVYLCQCLRCDIIFKQRGKKSDYCKLHMIGNNVKRFGSENYKRYKTITSLMKKTNPELKTPSHPYKREFDRIYRELYGLADRQRNNF
jgi:hypothetical protein